MQSQHHPQLKSTDLFKIQASSLRWIGVWPGVVRPQLESKHVVQAIVHFVFMLVILGCELMSVINHMGNLQLQLEFLSLSGTRVINTVKIFVIIWKRSAFQEFLQAIDRMVVDEEKPSSRKFYHEMWRLESRFSKGLVVFMHTAFVIYVLIPVVRLVKTRENQWQLPLQIDIPFDYENYLLYPITFVASGYSIFLIATTYIGADGLIVACCLYLSAQFNIVRHDIVEQFALQGDDEITFSSDQNLQIKQKLKTIIERHQRCIELTETMGEILVQIMFTQFFLSSMVMAMYCILSIQLSTTIHEMVHNFNCMAAGIFHMYLFCKSGTILADASSSIADAVYDMDWHKCDKDNRIKVQLMMVRAQKPCQITAPFVVASMETFGKILNSAMSFLTMLKSFF